MVPNEMRGEQLKEAELCRTGINRIYMEIKVIMFVISTQKALGDLSLWKKSYFTFFFKYIVYECFCDDYYCDLVL